MHGRIYYFTTQKNAKDYDEDTVYVLMEEAGNHFDYVDEINKKDWESELLKYMESVKNAMHTLNVKENVNFTVTFNKKGIEEYLKNKKNNPIAEMFDDTYYVDKEDKPYPELAKIESEETWMNKLLNKMKETNKEEISLKVKGIYDYHF